MTFPKTLTPMALNQRSFGWFEVYPFKPIPRGLPSFPFQLRGPQNSSLPKAEILENKLIRNKEKHLGELPASC